MSSSRESASLGDFVSLLRLRKALVFLVLALVVLTTGGVTALLPKWYLSTAKIRVEKPESDQLFRVGVHRLIVSAGSRQKRLQRFRTTSRMAYPRSRSELNSLGSGLGMKP